MKAKQFVLLAGMSALLVGMSILPAPVAAQGVEFDFGNGGVRMGRPYDDDRRYYRRDDRRGDWRDDRGYRPGCSPREALAAASRYLNDPRINSVRRGVYYIDGFGKRGGARNRPDSVYISAAPGCARI